MSKRKKEEEPIAIKQGDVERKTLSELITINYREQFRSIVKEYYENHIQNETKDMGIQERKTREDLENLIMEYKKLKK